jgi:hypothetical protein
MFRKRWMTALAAVSNQEHKMRSLAFIVCSVAVAMIAGGCGDGATPRQAEQEDDLRLLGINNRLQGEWGADFSALPNWDFYVQTVNQVDTADSLTPFYRPGSGRVVFDNDSMTMERGGESVSFTYRVAFAPTDMCLTMGSPEVIGFGPTGSPRVASGRSEETPTGEKPVIFTKKHGWYLVEFGQNGEAQLTQYFGPVPTTGLGESAAGYRAGFGRLLRMHREER